VAALIGNMWFLWIFGDSVEDVLGHAPYLLFYLVCGAAAASAAIVAPLSNVPMVGAQARSPAFSAPIWYGSRGQGQDARLPWLFFTVIELPAPIFLIIWFVVQFFSGTLALAAAARRGRVAWFATSAASSPERWCASVEWTGGRARARSASYGG